MIAPLMRSYFSQRHTFLIRIIFFLMGLLTVPINGNSGPFELTRIDISGSDYDQKALILFYSDLSIGHTYTRPELEQELANTQHRLVGSSYFYLVDITPHYEGSSVRIHIDITDNFPYQFGPIMGIKNVKGKAEDYMIGFLDGVSVDLNKKGLWLNRGFGTIQATYIASPDPIYINGTRDTFKKRDIHLELGYGLRWGFSRVLIGLGQTYTDYYDRHFTSTPSTFGHLDHPSPYSYTTLSYRYQHTDSPYIVSTGTDLIVNGKWTDNGWGSPTLRATRYTQISPHLTIATQIYHGIISGRQAPYSEYFNLNEHYGTHRSELNAQLRYRFPDIRIHAYTTIPVGYLFYKWQKIGMDADLGSLEGRFPSFGAGLAILRPRSKTTFDLSYVINNNDGSLLFSLSNLL